MAAVPSLLSRARAFGRRRVSAPRGGRVGVLRADRGRGAVRLAVTLAVIICGLAVAGRAQTRPAASAERPGRIISLVPATTEMLFAIGAGDRVVGIGNYDKFPPEVERLPRVGGLIDPNKEAILALKPDLVVVYETQQELKTQLERAGIAVFDYTHRGLPDITETIRRLGARVGSASDAGRVADGIEQRLAAVKARVAGRARPKTLLIFGREPGALRQINASAGYGFLHDLLELAGGADVLGDLKRQSMTLSTEMILTRAPEVIIELHYGESLRPDRVASERQVWRALSSVPAVRHDRVYLMTGDEFVVPGPRIVLAAERFAQALHP